MAAVFLKPSTEAKNYTVFGSSEPPHAALCGCDVAGMDAMAAAGLSWLTILQFLWKYGPMITTVANQTIAALRSSGGLTLEFIQSMIQQHGEEVRQMIMDLLQALGLNLPS